MSCASTRVCGSAIRSEIPSDLREVTVLPSIFLNYDWTRDLSLELEVGAKLTERQQAGATETETDLFFTIFCADGHMACGFMRSCRK